MIKNTDMTIPVVLGTSPDGEEIIIDLAEAPHILIGGSQSYGEKTTLRSIIVSLVQSMEPARLKLFLADTRFLTFPEFRQVSRYVEYSPAECDALLSVLCEEMDRRFGRLFEAKCRNIKEFNETGMDIMPYIVCAIHDYADLVLGYDGAYSETVRDSIIRIAQKGRAVGIHLIIATERPDRDVISAAIKVNFPIRIAFRTTSTAGSRLIIDNGDAVSLSKGEMILVDMQSGDAGERRFVRVKGNRISDDAVRQAAQGASNRGFHPFGDSLSPEC